MYSIYTYIYKLCNFCTIMSASWLHPTYGEDSTFSIVCHVYGFLRVSSHLSNTARKNMELSPLLVTFPCMSCNSPGVMRSESPTLLHKCGI